MSTPIRPPGGPSLPGVDGIGIDGVEGAVGIDGVQPGQRSEVSEVAGASSATSARQVESPTASVLARLEAGELTREQAVDDLVGQAVEAYGGAQLPAAQRDELASVLKAALLGDPALGALLGSD